MTAFASGALPFAPNSKPDAPVGRWLPAVGLPPSGDRCLRARRQQYDRVADRRLGARVRVAVFLIAAEDHDIAALQGPVLAGDGEADLPRLAGQVLARA